MLPTYRATLRGNQLQWQGVAPPRRDAELTVLVTILDKEGSIASVAPERGSQMAAALEKLAALPARSIADPVLKKQSSYAGLKR